VPVRKIKFVKGEYYHIYNRGVDKRSIVCDPYDSNRFVQSLDVFNDTELTGSLYELSFITSKNKSRKKLVDIIAYCLNPNHFHFILEQISPDGISKFMHRISGGHSWYFNNKYKRKGALFQGVFKAKHILGNDYLLHLSAYVNLNDQVHKLGGPAAKLVRSSWPEYFTGEKGLCNKGIIKKQFKTQQEYEKFCETSLLLMVEKKTDAELDAIYHE